MEARPGCPGRLHAQAPLTVFVLLDVKPVPTSGPSSRGVCRRQSEATVEHCSGLTQWGKAVQATEEIR